MLVLSHIKKKFGETPALDGVSLSVTEGETLVLLGTSGCGKSTVLKVILGLVQPDHGEVSFQGKVITPELHSFVRSRVGYVIQSGGLFPHLSARKNIAIVANYLKWPPSKISERTDELTRLVKIEPHLLDKFPSQLSGGQSQRIGLMRALMLDPDVLLLDEPLGALDPITRRDLQIELKDIFNNLKKTVILVTHDLPEAEYFGDEIALMNCGRVVQTGKMRDLCDSPADEFVSRFINAQK
jgi:osmoprotectant transport system ATP-binding protein